MKQIETEKEIETGALSIVQLKECIEAVIAELEAEGFDPKVSSLYVREVYQILEVTCYRDETPDEVAKRVAEEEAERVAYEASQAEYVKRKRLRELEEQTIRLQQADLAARHHEMERILAGKTLAELRSMSTI